MPSRIHRIPAGADFEKLFVQGKRTHLPALSLVYVDNGKGETRYAVVVSISVTKRATARNRLRRQLSEHVRRLLPTMLLGYDCVFIVRSPALTARRDALREAATILLRRAGLLPPQQI